MLSRVQLFVTPWTVTYQASLSMGFPGKNTAVGCHFLLQIFLTQGLNPGLLAVSEALPGPLSKLLLPFLVLLVSYLAPVRSSLGLFSEQVSVPALHFCLLPPNFHFLILGLWSQQPF